MPPTLPSLAAAFALALPSVAAAQSFEGPSVGLQLSYADAETSGPALDGDDPLFGLRAYYDWDLGDYVIGTGLQYEAGDVGLTGGVATIDDVFRLAGRVGITRGPGYYYVTAGYAYADTSGPAAAGSSDGYFIGIGYEGFVSDQVTLGAELLYHEFDSFDIPTLEADVTTLNLSVNYRF
ncbi:MAG: outer membrane beta-barrel protein [Pseudomonadota bacterium]